MARIGTDLGVLRIGELTTRGLRTALEAMDAGLNDSAELLLGRPEMAVPEPVDLALVSCSVRDLGLPGGGTLDEVFAAARAMGLALCPLATGPYLRLVHREAASRDRALHRRRPPEAALHVASQPLDPRFEVPKGFYLRTVEGRRWLRGYRCSDDYVVPPDTVHVFTRA